MSLRRFYPPCFLSIGAEDHDTWRLPERMYLEYPVVTSANMHTKPNLIVLLFAHEGLGFIQDRLVEGKEVYDFCFILDEEFVETDTPAFNQNVFVVGYNSASLSIASSAISLKSTVAISPLLAAYLAAA